MTLFILSSTFGATIKLQSREYVENNKDEILEVDARLLRNKDEKVRGAENILSSIRGSKETFISTQHI